MNTHALIAVVGIIASFGAGFFTGRGTADIPLEAASIQARVNSETSDTSETSASAGTEVQLTADQRKLLESFGIDSNNVTVTAEMIACAEAKLGASRVAEIKGGATPSFMEGTKLLACYNAN